MGVCGQGCNPDGVSFVVSWCLYLCRRTGCRHWCVDATLRTHFVIVDNIHCRLSTHLSLSSQGIVPQQCLLCFVTPPLCPMHAQLAGRLSTTTSSRRASVHWFLKPLRAVHFLTFQHLRALSWCPLPLHSVFAIEQLLLARWLRVQCFLSLPLTLPTQCVLLPWNVAKSSETSCCVVWGVAEACRLKSRCCPLVSSQPRSFENSCRVSP